MFIINSKSGFITGNLANQNQRMFLRGALLLLSALFLFACSADPKDDPEKLAVIEDRIVTRTEFKNRFTELKTRLGIPDNGMTRRGLLKNYVEEELLILEAIDRGYDSDPDGRFNKEEIKIQELLNAYNRKFIQSKVRVTEKELRELFIHLNTRIRARHLYAPTKAEAESLYQAILDGASFQELAKAVFQDPVLRESGGDLGYFEVDEMDPAFEEAAFSLKVAQVSEPVKTNDGYSIIQLLDKKTKPLITEMDYAKHRHKLEPYWRQRKVKKMTRLHVDSLRRALEIEFVENTLDRLFSLISEHEKNEALTESQTLRNMQDALDNLPLLTSKQGNWDVDQFQKMAKFTSDAERNWIRNKENLRDYIAGLVVRAYILRKAQDAGLHKTAEYKNKVEEEFDVYLLGRIEDNLRREMEIPEDSLKLYYEDDPRLFDTPPKIHLREIILQDTYVAGQVAKKLKAGHSFEELARKYSLKRRSALNGGDIGYLTPQELGKWAELAFSMQENHWLGPVKMDSAYVFLQCLDKIPARPRSFREASADVESALRTFWWERFRSQKVAELRSEKNVRAFHEKLRTIRFN